MKTQILDPRNPGNDSKFDWHSMLNYGVIITDNEGNVFDFDFSFVKVGCMKNVPFIKTNALTSECRL
jgi:hypothetical protein